MPKRERKRITNYELRIKNENGEKASQGQTGGGFNDDRKGKVKKLKVKNFPIQKSQRQNQAREDKVTKFDNEKVERDKKLFMWVGVSCLMVIFFVIWILNLKYEFKASLNNSANSGFNWSQTKVELDKAMTQVKQGLAEIKKIQASSNQNASSSPRYAESSGEASEPKLTAEQLNLLKGKLLNEVASSTATSTKTIKN